MAEYPGTENERRVAPRQLESAVSQIFEACGMTKAHASLLAHSLAVADQRGIHSHGTLRVPDYVDKLTTGGVDPRGQPVVVSANGAALIIDARNAMGQIAADVAMTAAIDKARTNHIAIAVVRDSNHCGAMDHWAAMALPHDMIGIAATNALPTMAPWGGIDKIVGINPLAVAIPAGEAAADRARHRFWRDRPWQDPRLSIRKAIRFPKAGPLTRRESRRPTPLLPCRASSSRSAATRAWASASSSACCRRFFPAPAMAPSSAI